MTFAEAAAEWLRFIEQDRGCKPSTMQDYGTALKAHLLPVFGDDALEDDHDERSSAGAASLDALSNRRRTSSSPDARDLPARAEGLGLRRTPLRSMAPLRPSGDIEVFSPEEVWALVRAAPSRPTRRSS